MSKSRKTFRSQWSYRKFVGEVTRSNPYFRSDESEEFLRTLLETAKNRVEVISEGKVYWRAQSGHGWKPIIVGGVDIDDSLPYPHPQDRMKPLGNKARENRANPKGIPYLYCASDRDTAMAELRPWKGETLSLGEFIITRDIKVINCITENPRTFPYYYRDDPDREPPPKAKEHLIWSGIDRVFSRPVSLSDNTAEYLPSQIIAGLFKDAGYDGVKYGSSLGKGYNLALFDTKDVKLEYCCLVETEEIQYLFGEAMEAYWIRDNKQLTQEAYRAETDKQIQAKIRARSKKKDN